MTSRNVGPTPFLLQPQPQPQPQPTPTSLSPWKTLCFYLFGLCLDSGKFDAFFVVIFCENWPCVNQPMCVSLILLLALRFPVASSSEMFDWGDDELADIIWGEATENDDHIVPYPEGGDDCRTKKEWKQETTTTKTTEQKLSVAKTDLDCIKTESGSSLANSDGISASAFGIGSWSDLPLSNVPKTEQDSMGTEVCNSLTEITKYDSSGGTSQLDKDAEIYQGSNEVKEQGDLVDYGWDNIGSFDDFDRIFSNDGTVFGHVNLGNADELWSSSRDVTNNPVKSFPISSELLSLGIGTSTNGSQNLEAKAEYLLQNDPACTISYGKAEDSSSHMLQNVHVIFENVEDTEAKNKPVTKEKTNLDLVGKTIVITSHPAAHNLSTKNKMVNKVTKQKKYMKSRKRLEEKSSEKPMQDMYGAWSSSRNTSAQLENACSMLQSSTSSVQQRQQLQGPELYQYQHISNQFVAPSLYGNMTNPYPAMPVLSHIQAGKFKQQPLLSSYEVSPGNQNRVNKLAENTMKHVTMTPQEKIEKLRRRQQLRAMVAIQKQHQQFSQQISSSNNSAIYTSPQENQKQHFEGTDLEIEDLNYLPSLDPNSPLEQDESNTISAAVDDYSAEEATLNRLQDIITKLDVKVRLCIRDSLFRLAESVVQRHYSNDTSTNNKSHKDDLEDVASNRLPDAETETNPIDRTVAHLLFHRPLELSGKQPEASESPVSPTKLPSERKHAAVVNLPTCCLTETSKDKQSFAQQESKDYSPLAEPDQYRKSTCLDTSESASKNGLKDGDNVLVGSSQ